MGLIANLVDRAKKALSPPSAKSKSGYSSAADLIWTSGIRGQQKVPATNSTVFSTKWHQVWPYQFVVLEGDVSGTYDKCVKYIYSLPIPPESLTVSMIPASQVTATLGGVVEETNENVFWNIQLTGTTGIAVTRTDSTDDNAQFRKSITTTGLLCGISNALSAIDNLDESVSNAVDDFDVSNLDNAIDSGLDLAASALMPKLPYSRSAVDGVRNGFTEIHELNHFLYAYSVLKGREPNNYRLYFLNHKDSQRWRVVPVGGIGVMKSKESPFLYRYSITLKGWGMRTPDFVDAKAVNRFGRGGDLQAVNTLTVTGSYTMMKDAQIFLMKASRNPVAALNIAPPIL